MNGEEVELVSIEEAAERLGTSRETIRRRILRGDLSVYADGRDRRRRLLNVRELDLLSLPKLIRDRRAA